MPRLNPPPPSIDHPDYFDSLLEVANYCRSFQTSRRLTSSCYIPYSSNERPAACSKLTVCHDYKGGYTESRNERQFIYRHWAVTSSFIYFSHHRLSIPPAPWINTAHRHGTKMLGCLIFEHEESREDVIRLTRGEGNDFALLRTEYADYLVELAVARGFEGM
jgi:mannosyl-glycoprotein endo-beta-N-acetylglucosaminidase